MLSKINIFPMSTQCLVNDLTTFGKTTQVKEHRKKCLVRERENKSLRRGGKRVSTVQ